MPPANTSNPSLNKPDCLYRADFLPAKQAQQLFDQLIQEVCWRQDEIRLFGRTLPIPRLQAFQGDQGIHYRYSNLLLEAQPWHPLLEEIQQKLEQICHTPFNCVLLNLYRDGQDSMGWHSDDEPELGPDPVIASLTLGQARRFVMRAKHDKSLKQEYLLEDGSLLVMRGHTQRDWQHALPRSQKPMQARINLTFRYIQPN